MCGFVVVYSRREAVRPEILEKGLSVLQHRGPDGRKTQILGGGRVGLGHARLSIIDLVSGDQPLQSDDGKLACVVNGELYGYEAMRQDLIARGHHLRTASDSEIVLPLYREFGTDCVNHLRGEFAIALWDETHRTLFAARDRFGIKPLFYAEREGTLYLASEIKALLAMGIPARWDHESLYNMNCGSPFHPGRTLFEGIRQVPPGHFLVATSGGTRLLPYWDFDYPRQGAVPEAKSEAEWIAGFRERLEEAVRLRLRADVPVACYLSGGIDSSAVLGLAALHSPQPLQAFTLSFAERAYDESEIAAAMAKRSGSAFTPVPVTESAMADHYAEAIWHAESVFINPHAVARFLLSRAVRNAGFKVVLTGEGSDEILAGYAHFRQDALRLASLTNEERAERLQALEASNQASRGLLHWKEEHDVPSLRLALGGVPTFMAGRAATAPKVRFLMNPEFTEAFTGVDPCRPLLNELDVGRQLRGRELVHQSMYLWSKTVLPNYNLGTLGDRAEMANSIEGRVPFLDHHLVEYVVRAPLSLKIHGTTEKFLLREAVRDVVTPALYAREKHPFLAPPVASELGSRMHELMQDTFRSLKPGALPCYDPEMLTGFLENFVPDMSPDDRRRVDPLLNTMLSLALMTERFGLSS